MTHFAQVPLDVLDGIITNPLFSVQTRTLAFLQRHIYGCFHRVPEGVLKPYDAVKVSMYGIAQAVRAEKTHVRRVLEKLVQGGGLYCKGRIWSFGALEEGATYYEFSQYRRGLFGPHVQMYRGLYRPKEGAISPPSEVEEGAISPPPSLYIEREKELDTRAYAHAREGASPPAERKTRRNAQSAVSEPRKPVAPYHQPANLEPRDSDRPVYLAEALSFMSMGLFGRALDCLPKEPPEET